MNFPEFEIAGRKIGYNFDPLVIVEIGINHEGSLEVAFEMVDVAYTAGAEIIKHQTHIIEDEMSGEAASIIPGNTDQSIYDVMKRCALNEEDELKLKEYIEAKGMIFISTPFSRKAADRLEKFNVPAYKIGSGECNNYPLLEYVASFGKPIILSTGMNEIPAIEKAVSIFRKYQISYSLLHCTNIYPTPPELVRLGAVTELQEKFPDAVVGLSDHTVNNFACLGAVALGASILERHFTDSMQRIGPDIICSMDGAALKELISGAKYLKKERGGSKNNVKQEQVTKHFAYASVVSISEIEKGDVLSTDNIWVKRPGTGDFLAEDYKMLLGKKAKINIPVDVQIKKSFIEIS